MFKRIFIILITASIAFFSCQESYVCAEQTNRIEINGLRSITAEEFLYLLDLRHGEPLNRQLLSKGIKRAFMTGIFEDIIVESIGAAAIRVTAKEKPVINSIRINGADNISERIIRKEFAIKKGDRLNLFKIKKGVESVEKLMRIRGFPQANVVYRIIEAKDHHIDIEVNVSEGMPEIISKIYFIEPDDVMRSYLGISEGDILDRAEISRASEKSKAYYKNQGFVGVKIDYSYDSDGSLRIHLNKGKKINITFSGNTVISSSDLIKEIPFFELDEITDDLIEETTVKIISQYHKRGYPYVQIAPIIIKNDDEMNIEFYIFEGEHVTVGSVFFESSSGSLSAPQETLLSLISLRSGANYNPQNLEADTQTLTEFYQALGYLYVVLNDPVTEVSGNMVSIKHLINEGIQVKISSIRVKNNLSKTETEILNALNIRIGSPYNEIDISDARRKIIELYNKNGYLDVKVSVERDIEGSSAAITFNISEGAAFVFGKTLILQNEYTKNEVILRELVHRERMPLNNELLFQERRELYRLGLFNDIDIEFSDAYEITQGIFARDVIYKVQEANFGAFEFGVGYGEYERFRGFFDVSYKNLFGMNRQASLRTEVSSIEQRYILTYNEPWFIFRDAALKALLMHEYRKEQTVDSRETRYRLRRETASIGIEKKISENFKAELYYDLSYVKILEIKPDVVLSKEDTGTLVISALRPGIIYDTRDNPYEPKKGFIAGITLKAASSVLLSESQFIKVQLYVNKYNSLNDWLTLAVSARAGFANGIGNTNELPITERFFLGGRSTVRGYEQDMLGPKGSDGNPTGGNAFLMGNIEFRSNIGRGFGIVSFLDGGNVWQKTKQINVGDLRYTAGLGLRYGTPVGPLRVDYGYKLGRRSGENKSEIHFSLGHAF